MSSKELPRRSICASPKDIPGTLEADRGGPLDRGLAVRPLPSVTWGTSHPSLSEGQFRPCTAARIKPACEGCQAAPLGPATRGHTHTHTDTQRHTHRGTQRDTHTDTDTHTQRHAHRHTETRTQTHTHRGTYTPIHVDTHRNMGTYTQKYTNPYIHTHMNRHAGHAHTHTCCVCCV